MKTCYLCNTELTEKNDHGEHIFQQALGGTLVEKGILCKECGNKLGKEIDVDFVNIFRNYTSRLPINFDRKTKKESEIGRIYISKFNRIFEFKSIKKDLLPTKPDAFLHQNNLIIIYPKGYSNLEKYKNKKMQEFNITSENNITIIQTFNDYENITETPFNLDNMTYKRGMAKIAIGFAIKNGINREELDCVLDYKNNKIQEKIALIPYMPWDFIHGAIEEARFSIDNLEYLSHQIKIFNKENILNCYIELFGTFQCYILLSKNYSGKDVYCSYMQPIFKLNRMELPCLPRKQKDLLLYKHLLSENEPFGYNNETLKKINEIIRKQKNELDLDEYYSNLINHVSIILSLFINNESPEIPYYSYELVDFFKKNSKLIKDNIINIMKRLKWLSEDPKFIKQDVCWEMIANLLRNNHLINRLIYQYNQRKMNKLEEMIKYIHGNKDKFSIWNTDYSG